MVIASRHAEYTDLGSDFDAARALCLKRGDEEISGPRSGKLFERFSIIINQFSLKY